MSSRPPSPSPYSRGDEIPGTRCTFERVLGEGGYGTVLLCRHVVLERKVVLKLLLASHLGRDDLVDRMLAEARALAQLDHANIALIHDAGMTGEADPRPFLTLQYYPGETLAQALAAMPRGSGIGLIPALDLGIELCDALRAAHERGIVHRDVKPANVYLARTGEGRTVTKVIDFGIAHFKEATTRATGKMYLGTPRYSAPEQIQGLPPSARTDLYAVGLVLYDCLCGRGPFDPPGGHLDANEMIRAHLKEEPAPLSAYWPDVPEDLAALVSELVAKAPDERPPAASLVATRLCGIKARVLAAQSSTDAGVDPNRTEPTPFDNRQIRYSAGTDGTSPATGAPEPIEPVAAVEPAGTVLLPPAASDGADAALPAATCEPLDRGAATASMVPETARGPTHGTEEGGAEPPAIAPAEEVPRTLSNNPTAVSIPAPAPRSRDRLRARLLAALGGAVTAAALSAGIWSLRHAGSNPAASPVGAVGTASLVGGASPKLSPGQAPVPASGLASSAARMLAAPAETTSPSASSAAKAGASAVASSSARPGPVAPGARSRATEKPKGDPLSDLKHTFGAPPGPLERPGVTF